MNLYYVKVEEDYYETEGYPEEEKYLVVANDETEALETAKMNFLELRDEEDWARYKERCVCAEPFLYTGEETTPFVHMRF